MTLTIEMLTLIALWCGNPVMGAGIVEGYYREDVDRCRAQIVACASNVQAGKNPFTWADVAERCVLSKKIAKAGK